MTRYFIAALTLVLMCQSVSADYYIGFTQVDAQPHLGRLAIHRGIVRSAKYVDWMCEHREELAKEGIFPDADPGGMIEINQSWVIDGQTIEVHISSNHLPERTGQPGGEGSHRGHEEPFLSRGAAGRNPYHRMDRSFRCRGEPAGDRGRER